jgi:glycosyltransferase involved in cell wall biosynthesis
MHRDKKKWFTQFKNATILPVSNWLAGEVGQSLLNCYTIKPVYNWINHSVFVPKEDSTTAKKYTLKTKKFTIICVSAYWNKNTVRYDDLIEFASEIGDEYQIIVVGKIKNSNDFPANCIAIPYVNGKAELAKLYNFADVYLHLSTEDTFGLVIAEAMSCGTPVVVNNVTACPEIIGEGCGYAIESRDNIDRIAAIKRIEINGKSFYSKKCRAHVLHNFDMKINITKILDVYKKAI